MSGKFRHSEWQGADLTRKSGLDTVCFIAFRFETVSPGTRHEVRRQRVCRPLDKPLIPKLFDNALDFDAAIDADTFMDAGSDSYANAQPALALAIH